MLSSFAFVILNWKNLNIFYFFIYLRIAELPADVELDLEGSGCILVQTVLRLK